MTLLADKPNKWDAADATLDERRAILEAVSQQKPDFVGKKRIRLADWTTRQYMGVPKPQRWLVKDTIPMGCAVLLAAAGGTGKGLLTLDLALSVAQPPPPKIDLNPLLAFGCTICERGTAVILAAEDSRAEVHRRLVNIDYERARRNAAGERLVVLTMPDAGGTEALVTQKGGDLTFTDFFHDIREQLIAMQDLRLVVVDPLASFVRADVNADPDAATFVMNGFGTLAAQTGATVMVTHHMSKGSRDRPIINAEMARAAVRGSTGLVDGVRLTYAVWGVDPDRAKGVCRKIDTPWKRDLVFEGAVVKANVPADTAERIYFRDEKSGLLRDMSVEIARHTTPPDELADDLVRVIALAADKGQPLCRTGQWGLYERRATMPKAFRNVSAARFKAMADELLERREIVLARPRGASNALDIPGGPIAEGMIPQVVRTAVNLNEGGSE